MCVCACVCVCGMVVGVVVVCGCVVVVWWWGLQNELCCEISPAHNFLLIDVFVHSFMFIHGHLRPFSCMFVRSDAGSQLVDPSVAGRVHDYVQHSLYM